MIKTLNKQLSHCESDLQTHMDLVSTLETSLGDSEKNRTCSFSVSRLLRTYRRISPQSSYARNRARKGARHVEYEDGGLAEGARRGQARSHECAPVYRRGEAVFGTASRRGAPGQRACAAAVGLAYGRAPKAQVQVRLSLIASAPSASGLFILLFRLHFSLAGFGSFALLFTHLFLSVFAVYIGLHALCRRDLSAPLYTTCLAYPLHLWLPFLLPLCSP